MTTLIIIAVVFILCCLSVIFSERIKKIPYFGKALGTIQKYIGAVLLILLAGCGGDLSGVDITHHTKTFWAKGGTTASFTSTHDIYITSNSNIRLTTSADATSYGTSVTSWKVSKNTGGAGTATIKSAAYNADCSTAVSLLDITFAAAATTTAADFSDAQIATLNGLFNTSAGSGFRLCITITQTDTATPVDFEIEMDIVSIKNL